MAVSVFSPWMGVLLLGAGALACATAAPTPAREFVFTSRPPRASGCEFEVWEEREPPRPFTVVGGLPFTANEWLGLKGRKDALRETVCESGADAVLLGRPAERRLGRGAAREYQAWFIAYTDVPPPPPPEAPAPETPEGPLPKGSFHVPVMTTGAKEEPEGTQTREVRAPTPVP
ncbi:hypothetical protein DRW03_15695 [Corallococcus sp. H22C18031201]|nr:hypothetical protein DRW03_15695 [Corallococcus sp. H22C18031201]